MADNEETISISKIIDLAHWNKQLVEELLGEPDVRLTHPSGKVYSSRYSLCRFNEAELHPKIVERKENIINDKNRVIERSEEALESIRYAIVQDLKNLKMNYGLCFADLIKSLKAQMYLYNGIMDNVDSKYLGGYYELAMSRQGVGLHIEKQIALFIKEKHNLYAFEAGRYYEGHTNIVEYPFCQLTDRDD